MAGNPTMIFAKHRSSISPLLLVLLLLLVLVFMTLSADAALTPVYMHYYCRQQCEQRFKMCAMGASESSFIFQPRILSGLSYFRVVVSCRHWRFVFSLALIDLGYGVLTFEGGVESVPSGLKRTVWYLHYRSERVIQSCFTFHHIFLIIMCCRIV